MKCEQCQAEGRQSKVHPGMSTMTCLGYEPFYYDENGDLRGRPDPNTTTTHYRCSNGHTWSKPSTYGQNQAFPPGGLLVR